MTSQTTHAFGAAEAHDAFTITHKSTILPSKCFAGGPCRCVVRTFRSPKRASSVVTSTSNGAKFSATRRLIVVIWCMEVWCVSRQHLLQINVLPGSHGKSRTSQARSLKSQLMAARAEPTHQMVMIAWSSLVEKDDESLSAAKGWLDDGRMIYGRKFRGAGEWGVWGLEEGVRAAGSVRSRMQVPGRRCLPRKQSHLVCGASSLKSNGGVLMIERL